MNTKIFTAFAPAALVASLGRCGPPAALMKALEPLGPQASAFRASRVPYAVQLTKEDADLMLQCVNPDAPEGERLWGVNSWIARPSATRARSTLQHMVQALGEPLLNMEGTAVFEGQEEQGAAWSALCALDGAGIVRMLTVQRRGDWVPIAAPKEKEVTPTTPLATPPLTPATPRSVAAPTCKSSGVVPKTGWYEGLLPVDHPKYRYFSQGTGRFVRKREGERMLTLGVVPMTDEDLVVWTWRGEDFPRSA